MTVHTQSAHFHRAFAEGDFEERSFSYSNKSDDIALPYICLLKHRVFYLTVPAQKVICVEYEKIPTEKVKAQL